MTFLVTCPALVLPDAEFPQVAATVYPVPLFYSFLLFCYYPPEITHFSICIPLIYSGSLAYFLKSCFDLSGVVEPEDWCPLLAKGLRVPGQPHFCAKLCDPISSACRAKRQSARVWENLLPVNLHAIQIVRLVNLAAFTVGPRAFAKYACVGFILVTQVSPTRLRTATFVSSAVRISSTLNARNVLLARLS